MNKRSIYTKCYSCQMMGINMPESLQCGNCGSMDIMEYHAACDCFDFNKMALKQLEESNGIFGVDAQTTATLTLSRIADQSQQIKSLEAELEDIRKRLKGHPDSRLDGENGLAAVTMRGFELLKKENDKLKQKLELAQNIVDIARGFGMASINNSSPAMCEAFKAYDQHNSKKDNL